MIVKVCGMKYPDNINAVGALYPDFMGFIFYPLSSRYVVSLDTSDLDIATTIGRIGVFVNEDTQIIEERIKNFGLTGVQLHGNETPATCGYFMKKGYTVFKAFGINDDFNFNSLCAYADVVDMFVFDTKVKSHGGSGMKFDWSVLDKYQLTVPFLLSGGISENDALEVKKIIHPSLAGVDLNSCFEIKPGQKDVSKLTHFIQELYQQNDN